MAQHAKTGYFGHSCRYFDTFRGTYMRRMHTFLEESDAASLRRHHRRRAQVIATRMSQTSSRREVDKSPDASSRPMVFHHSVSRAQGSTESVAAACSSKGTGTVRSHRMKGDAIQALMQLALPQLGGLENRSAPVRKPWMVSTDSPASPDPACTTDLARSPSPCLNLDTLSSDDDGEAVIPRDISVCGSEERPYPGWFRSGPVDLPAASDSRDRRRVLQPQELSPVDWFFRRTVSMGRPEDGPDGHQQHSGFDPGSPAAGQQTEIISRRSFPGGRTSRYSLGATASYQA